MACKSAFLALDLSELTREALHYAAWTVQRKTAAVMMPAVADVSDLGFDATAAERLHMTFVFCGDSLLTLPADRLTDLNQQIEAAICRAQALHIEAPALQFVAFELFPPTKNNLLIARFEAPMRLRMLRHELWEICRAAGVAKSDDSEWLPHVTLGKFRASKAQTGRLTCVGLVQRLDENDTSASDDRVIPSVPDVCCRAFGVVLIGEQPKRAPLSWSWNLQPAET